jgi:hypothetical protein
MNNIWEVVTVPDLIKIIKENPEKFVILSLVLDSTPKITQTFIKKFIKDKSKKFPNMTFLYFKVSKRDMGKFSLIETNQDVYPLIYHIYDINNIFIKVTSAVKDTIIEAFDKGSEYYLKDLEKYDNSKSNPLKSSIQINTINNNIKQNNNEEILNNQNTENTGNTGNIKDDKDEWTKQQELMEEQQKMIAKIVNLQQKAKEYNLVMLEDIKQRKKEEEKLKKK